jgi:exosome complex component RRP41
MSDYLVSCTAGSTVNSTSRVQQQPRTHGHATLAEDVEDPLLDLNGLEEQELPFLTVATLGASDKVSVCMLETRMNASKLEEMLAVGIDGCRKIREILDGVVRAHGRKMLEEG